MTLHDDDWKPTRRTRGVLWILSRTEKIFPILVFQAWIWFIIGLAIVPYRAHRFAKYPWTLSSDMSFVAPSKSLSDPHLGVYHMIEIDGTSYTCSDGRSKFPSSRGGVLVAYSPSRPDKCRAKDMVGRLGWYEASALIMGIGGLFAGTSRFFWTRAHPGPFTRRRLYSPSIRQTFHSAAEMFFLLAMLTGPLGGIAVLLSQQAR